MAHLISHAKSVACCGILCTMFVEFPWVLLCVLRNFMGAPELCYVSDPFGCCATIYFFLWVCSSRSFAVVTMMNFRGILLRTVVGDEIFIGACIFHRLSIEKNRPEMHKELNIINNQIQIERKARRVHGGLSQRENCPSL